MRRQTPVVEKASQIALRFATDPAVDAGIEAKDAAGSLASLLIAPPRSGIEPWPPGPRTVAFIQQIAFSATWIG